MFGRRRNAGDRDLVSQEADLAAEEAETAGGAPTSAGPAGETGPWDGSEPHSELPRVDLGSILVPVLEGTDIQLVFAEQHGAWVTVRYQLSELQLQAFAAPKRAGIWDEVRGEIVNEINGTGGRCQERQGPFGTEVVAEVPAEPNQPASGVRPIRFIGVDGPRWFLRGLLAGAAAVDPAAAAPANRPRRNQRGPSTPTNLIGRTPEAGCPCSAGTCATSSVPNGPVRSVLWPPVPAISVAISPRTSSHSPLRLGAANACSCSSLS